MNPVDKMRRARDKRRRDTWNNRRPDAECVHCGYRVWDASPGALALFRSQHPDEPHPQASALTVNTDADAKAVCAAPYRIAPVGNPRPLVTLTPQEQAKIINAAKLLLDD